MGVGKNGNGFMGMGGNGNRNSPSRTPLIQTQPTRHEQPIGSFFSSLGTRVSVIRHPRMSRKKIARKGRRFSDVCKRATLTPPQAEAFV